MFLNFFYHHISQLQILTPYSTLLSPYVVMNDAVKNVLIPSLKQKLVVSLTMAFDVKIHENL